MAKKPRVRKAPTLREQAEMSRSASQSPAKGRLSKVRQSLPGTSKLAFLSPVFRPLRWLVPSYFVNSWYEVRQVAWPSRRETWRLTLAVFIFATIFGALVAGVD